MQDAFIFIFGVVVTSVALGPLLYAAVSEFAKKQRERTDD